jgi:hypothetical protein
MKAIAPVKLIGLGLAALLVLAAGRSYAASPPACQKIVLTGEVTAGREWKASIGEGWAFRVVPIDSTKPGNAAYNGWDLVVDRAQPAGFPDALLVATPPYNSINEREIGTTFGLRAQDAIGWNPRSFRFLTNSAVFIESQQLYLKLSATGQVRLASDSAADTPEARQTRRLMELEREASPGEFRILDAHLAPGIADAALYAENWAIALPKTQHQIEPGSSGKPSQFGELHWIRFSVTLWLPAAWVVPREIHASQSGCSQ